MSFTVRARVSSATMCMVLAPFVTVCGLSQERTRSFTISISSPSATVVSGSPIRIDAVLKSHTSEPVILPGLRTSPRTSGILVWDGTGKVLEPVESTKDRVDARLNGAGTEIPPGKAIMEPVLVNRWFDLSKPGQYTLQLRKKDPIGGGWIESNQLTIKVVPKT